MQPTSVHPVPARSLPDVGTLTFLFTDVEDSTPLWEQHEALMRAVTARHDALLDAIITRHGGQRVKERGEGDSLFAVFARPADAVAAALAMTRAVLAEPWPAETPIRVRIGLHTGAAQLRDQDYYGPVVNRCARIRGLGHGGQVLLSATAAALVLDALPPDTSLRSLGAHSLKGISAPEEVFQLCHPDLPTEFPPLHSLRALPHTQPWLPAGTTHARIFISYKRNVEPDEPVARQIYEALRRQHEVFIDQDIGVGTPWAERIEDELRRADFLIPFLSARSVQSEMVEAEIATARRLAAAGDGRPVILPVRLAYSEPFAYPLSAHLNAIQWAEWHDGEDTPRLIEELSRAVAGEALSGSRRPLAAALHGSGESPAPPAPWSSAQPAALELPEGTMDPHSAFYVLRPSDTIAAETIDRQGVTITIKGPRQMGKSSLLIRTVQAAAGAGKRVVFLDFQLFDKVALTDADHFFHQFCAWLTDELDIPSRLDEYWRLPLNNSQRCTRYMGRYVLREVGGPLVLAMDEVESIFDTSFRTDFFSMLRSWHNSRAITPAWRNLDLVLVTSTEPYQLIDDLNQSPFNVGQVIELADLTVDQVDDLNRRHGSPLQAEEGQRLQALVGGHPYLVRRALYLVSSGQLSAADLFARATDERGPFGDHLRYHLFRLHQKRELLQSLLEVIQQHTCRDERTFFRLRGAGLVRRSGGEVLPRCQLYATYFQERLNG